MTTARRTTRTSRPARRPAGESRAGARVVQLRLLGNARRPDWVLDSKTRRVGRAGVAEAREVLRRARPPQPGESIAS
jgi:hypothetical protein